MPGWPTNSSPWPWGPAVKNHPVSLQEYRDGVKAYDVRQRITQRGGGTGKIGAVQLTLRHVSAPSMQGWPEGSVR